MLRLLLKGTDQGWESSAHQDASIGATRTHYLVVLLLVCVEHKPSASSGDAIQRAITVYYLVCC